MKRFTRYTEPEYVYRDGYIMIVQYGLILMIDDSELPEEDTTSFLRALRSSEENDKVVP